MSVSGIEGRPWTKVSLCTVYRLLDILFTQQFVPDAHSLPQVLFDEHQTVDESQQRCLIGERVRLLQFHYHDFIIVSQLSFHLCTKLFPFKTRARTPEKYVYWLVYYKILRRDADYKCVSMLLRTLTWDKTDFAKIIPSAENTHSAHSSSYTCSFTVVLLHMSTAKKSHIYEYIVRAVH